MLKMKLKEAEDAAEANKKKPRKGISVSTLGTFHVTTDKVHTKVAAEASTAAKKRKGKGKVVQADREDLTEDPSFIQSHAEQN